MIDPLFEELAPIPSDSLNAAILPVGLAQRANSDDSLIAAIPIVQKIAQRKLINSWQTDIADLVQTVALRLFSWRMRYSERSNAMSPSDWDSFSARTAYNEINRHYSRHRGFVLPIDSINEIPAQEKVEGGTTAEVSSLVKIFWQEICSMSLRQRQALILCSQEFVVYLLADSVTDCELAKSLDLTIDEWNEIKERLPLSDLEIASISIEIAKNKMDRIARKETKEAKNLVSVAKSVKKARFEARTKLRRLIQQ
jgi:DNA-directed RNA polymerase specialized sigma24 family protein